MPTLFPPQTIYPQDYDSDRTLYQVYNTSETILISDLETWATTISIRPVDIDQQEIWGENGFVTIENELIYFESVQKDANNKINVLANCIRNLGGSSPKHYTAGTDVRGFVIAEHHNQIARSVVNTENFIGISLSQNKTTLDWRIRNLAAQGAVVDDYGCPEVNFSFYIASETSNEIVINYELEINGTFDSFLLEFGDGQSTTTVQSGTHSYSPNIIIDPTVTVIATNCEQVVSGVSREQVSQPLQQQIPIDLNVVVPTVPVLPEIPISFQNTVNNQLLLPPIVFPCVETGFGPISVPSVITIVEAPAALYPSN